MSMWDWDDLHKALEENGYKELYKRYLQDLSKEDFLRSSRIHGMAHTRRVLIHVLSLAHLLNLNSEDTALLCIASIYHDTGRLNDGPDPEHGKRSWQRVGEKPLIRNLAEEDRAILAYIMENHCLDDKVGLANIDDYPIADKERALRLLKVFKDADGLDRVRIYDLNPAYLRNEEARQLTRVAWSLFEDKSRCVFFDD